MKKIGKKAGVFALGSILLMTSCANEAPFGTSSEADGKINLNLLTDANVLQGTRADNVSPYVPNVAEFTIKLKSTDGTYSNSWKSLDAFNSEEGFPMGSYVISASFGDPDTEGFTSPYFYGESKVNVAKGKESSVDITATLANAMLSIRYSEEFSKFFPGYSATSTTKGHDPVVFVQNESRPAYIAIGESSIKLTLTNTANKTVTINPTTITNIEPQKHYTLTFGVDGNTNVADAVLSIVWSEEVNSVDEVIPLNEELFTSPGPEASLEGFDTVPSKIFEGLEYENVNPEFHVLSLGGLKEATLTLKNDDDSSVQSFSLVGADSNIQATLKGYGIDCAGLFEEKGKFGVVNLKNYVKGLNAGNYTVTLDVKDIYSRSLETPVEFKITITELNYSFLSYETPDFLDKEIYVYVQTNCPDLKNQLSFKSWGLDDNFVNVKQVEYVDDSKPITPEASLENVCKFKLTLNHAIDNWEWKVQVQAGKKDTRETQILVNMPQFTVETDAFARKVRFRFPSGIEENIKKLLLENAIIYNGNEAIAVKKGSAQNDDILLIDNLEPAKSYQYTINLGRTIYPEYLNNLSFTTEKEQFIENSNFADTQQTLYFKDIKVNGLFRVTFLFTGTYQVTSDIIRSEATGWSSLNDLTCYSKSQNENTWYMVPSTFVEESGVVTIRSVGFNHEGRALKETNAGGTFNTTYYCTDHPEESELQKRSGELFLGSYSFEENGENPNYGISFESRPSKLTFDYSYTPQNNETAYAEITLLDLEDNVIGTVNKKLDSRVSLFSDELSIPNYEFGRKASKIKIIFKSTSDDLTPSIVIPEGSKLNEGVTIITGVGNNLHRAANTYKAFAMGSELKISNVNLEY